MSSVANKFPLTHEQAETSACTHCGLSFPSAEAVIEQTDDQLLCFCCQGCRGAYQIITGSGLGSFYQRRSWEESGVPKGVFEGNYSDDLLDSYVTATGPESEIRLLIEGIRCATCIWLIEKVLGRLAGVSSVRVNYGTQRALIRFDRSRIAPSHIFSSLSSLGYRPRPLTGEATQNGYARERKTLLIRLGTAFFLSMQLMGYSLALYAGYFQGIDAETRNLMQIFSAIVTTPVVFYSGYPFLRGAFLSLKNRTANMDLLLSIGILTAYFSSIYALLTQGEVYFDTAAMIVTLILLGRAFEMGARRKASSGIDRLLNLTPETAHRIQGQDVQTVQSALLEKGELILVKPGERFAVDGLIVSGKTDVDESSVTGESRPIHRVAGEKLSSGSLNLSCAVQVEVLRPASESFIARVAHIVEEAQARRAPIQNLADRVSSFFVPTVLTIAALTWYYWWQSGSDPKSAILNAVSVLVIACPCALGLATPTAVLVASGAAASRGVLFRGGDVIERCAGVDLAAFDKTGTLTQGRPEIRSLHAVDMSEQGLLTLAAQAGNGSTHPLAMAIVEEARERGISPALPQNTKARPGMGMVTQTASGTVCMGNQFFFQSLEIEMPFFDSTPGTEVLVAQDQKFAGRIILEDKIRPETPALIYQLKKTGIQSVMLTGDRPEPAISVAETAGIQQIESRLSPEEKAAWIRNKIDEGSRVLMVGDGINDAPALSTASVSCAMAGGTDIALETSDIILVKPDLEKITVALSLARQTLRVIRQNLFWAFFYNLIAIPLAISGKLLPVHAAAAMALSSVFVLGNSLRLAFSKGQ